MRFSHPSQAESLEAAGWLNVDAEATAGSVGSQVLNRPRRLANDLLIGKQGLQKKRYTELTPLGEVFSLPTPAPPMHYPMKMEVFTQKVSHIWVLYCQLSVLA